jgi:hypothetical protein
VSEEHENMRDREGRGGWKGIEGERSLYRDEGGRTTLMVGLR